MGRTDRASRVIDAAADLVYDALSDPAALAVWLPPPGMVGRFDSFDLRPGGGYRLVLTFTEAGRGTGKATPDSDVVDARFLEVVEGERIVQEVDFVSDDPAYAGTMTMTWQLTAVPGGTLVDVRADDVPTGISADDHAAGLSSSLENLDRYVSDRSGG
jgi:uncharacterized protein YndB with AHSA1/START domain